MFSRQIIRSTCHGSWQRRIYDPENCQSDAAANRESWLADQPESSNMAANYERFSQVFYILIFLQMQ